MLKADVHAKLVLLLFKGGRVIPCQVICEFALKGDCGELFEQRCDKNLHMQLHAAALHFHCLSTPFLLTKISEGAWLFKETFIDAAPVLADFLSEVASAARQGRATAKAEAVEPSSRCSNKALECVRFFSDLPAPVSNYRALRSGMAAGCSQASFFHAK